MTQKLIKWIGVLLGALVGLVAVALTIVYAISGSRFNKTYDIPVEPVAAAADPEALARGEHLAVIRGCTDCHGENLAGEIFSDDVPFGTFYASNLTTGSGGIAVHSNGELARAIRHGVDRDGKPLIFMPSHEYFILSDEDVGDLVGYLRAASPVDTDYPEPRLGPVARILFLAGQLPLVPAELIDHAAARPAAPPPGVTVAYGEYLAAGCVGCHGPEYAGGPIPGNPPGAPPAANLTPAGPVGAWTADDFVEAMRTGIRPDGTPIDPFMPVSALAAATDDELQAIWLFLESLPPVETPGS